MTRRGYLLFSVLVLSHLLVTVAGAKAEDRNITIRITTELGEIEAVLDSARAPVTVANFLRYLDKGQYNGGVFHRTVTMDNQPNNTAKIEVIQGAINPAFADTTYPPQSGYPPIPLERTTVTGLKHTDGALSMARLGPDTATSGFFICIGDQPELDFGGKRNPDGQGFAAFGQVIQGMDVVRKIQMAPRQEQRLTPPITITNLERK